MRKIKFRGKRLDNGKWVYGDLMRNICGTRIVQYKESKTLVCDRSDWKYVAVDDNTIGQFTGVYDKNGTPIYEGDLVDVWNQGEHLQKGIIKYSESTCRFFIGNEPPSLCWNLSGSYRDGNKDTCLVVGNIHDKHNDLN